MEKISLLRQHSCGCSFLFASLQIHPSTHNCLRFFDILYMQLQAQTTTPLTASVLSVCSVVQTTESSFTRTKCSSSLEIRPFTSTFCAKAKNPADLYSAWNRIYHSNPGARQPATHGAAKPASPDHHRWSAQPVYHGYRSG